MKKLKLFFSVLTIVFAILGLTKTLSTYVAMPIMQVCLAVTMLITSREYKDKEDKNTSLLFLVVGIFALTVTAFNVATIIWGI